jgi:hypothetical protein
MRKLSVFALLILAMLPWSCEAVSANDLRQFVRGSWNDIRKAHAGKPTVVHLLRTLILCMDAFPNHSRGTSESWCIVARFASCRPADVC